VLNNPLSFTDPTGFSWWTQWRRPIFAIGAATFAWWAAPYVGAYFGGLEAGTVAASTGATEQAIGAAYASGYAAGQAATVIAGGFAAGGIQGGNIESALQGALFAGLNFGIGEITSGPTGASLFGNGAFAANVGLHAAVGCAQQAAAGGSCKAGAMSGGFSALAGPVTQEPGPLQFAAHIAIGGIASRLGGDSFENGAITAAFAYLFNCGAHPGTCLSGKAQDDLFSSSRYHSYEEFSYICDTSQTGCTREAVFEQLRRFPTPGFPIDGGVTTGQVTTFGDWKIQHVVDPGNFAVFNITVPGEHGFDPGYVYRNVQIYDGRIYVQTFGEGTGGLRMLNVGFTGGGGWQTVDARIRMRFLP